MFRRMKIAVGLLVMVGFSPAVFAQFNNQWLEFVAGANKFKNPNGSNATQISGDLDEKDYSWADLNKDGWEDLVVVRKELFSTPGKRVSYLLMGENGTLVDRTTQYASASTLGGDFGFNTPTNSRDVKIGDVNGDGWLDVVTIQTDITSTQIPTGDPNPRIYINLGDDLSGNWLGLRFEHTRIPQILTPLGANGMLRFCDGSLGDIDNDGDMDLYITDYDELETSYPTEPVNLDVNDRLLINNGTGFYTDATAAHMPAAIYTAHFGAACDISKDINGDGFNDIVRCTTLGGTLGGPIAITAAYNLGIANPGVFDVAHYTNNVVTGSPYHFELGDLNNDGKLDMTVTTDQNDLYIFNTGINDALGRVIWSATKNFTWLTGSGDNAISGQSNRLVDLNLDGWLDAVNPSVDVDAFGCARYSFIFHNLGGTIGATNIVLREEKELSGAGGWFGAKGMVKSDFFAGIDAAFMDIDHDGDPDMILGRCAGTFVWMNQTNPVYCQTDLGFGTPSGPVLSVCGGAPLALGFNADVLLNNAPPSAIAFAFLGVSTSNPPTTSPTPLYINGFLAGTLVPVPFASVVTLFTDANGQISGPGIVSGGGFPIPVSIYLQVVVADGNQPSGYAFSNAVRIDLLANPQ